MSGQHTHWQVPAGMAMAVTAWILLVPAWISGVSFAWIAAAAIAFCAVWTMILRATRPAAQPIEEMLNRARPPADGR